MLASSGRICSLVAVARCLAWRRSTSHAAVNYRPLLHHLTRQKSTTTNHNKGGDDDKLGPSGYIRRIDEPHAEGCFPQHGEEEEPLPSPTPVDKIKHSVGGSVRAVAGKAKEIIDRDTDPTVEMGDQASDSTEMYQKQVKAQAEKARETINRDAGRWTAGTGTPGGIDMPPPSSGSSSEAPRKDNPVVAGAVGVLGKAAKKVKESVGGVLETVKSRAAGAVERIKTRLEDAEDAMQVRAAEERRQLHLQKRHQAEEEAKKKKEGEQGGQE